MKLKKLIALMYANDLVRIKDSVTVKQLEYGVSNDILVFSRYTVYDVVSIMPFNNELVIEINVG